MGEAFPVAALNKDHEEIIS